MSTALISVQEIRDDELIMTSHSIDGTMEVCPRRFEFLHVYMRAPEHESDAYAADVGTALHEATQEWQRKLFAGMSHEDAIDAGRWELLRWWPWREESKRRAEGKAIGTRTLGNSLILLDKIVEHESWQEWELVEIEGFGPAIEVPWRIVHKSLGQVPTPHGKKWLATQGKIDFILRHRESKRYRVRDLKTTEKRKVAHEAAFRFSGQASQYGLVLDQALGLDWVHNGIDIEYMMAMFPQVSDTEIDEPYVYNLNYHVTPLEVQDAIDIKMERLLRMKGYAEASHWPRRAHGCEFYSTPCGFLDICHRRDEKFLTEWFEFEIESGRFHEYKRVYDPVWILEA